MQRNALCRSRRELSEYLPAKIGVDTAENEPLEVWGNYSILFNRVLSPAGGAAAHGALPVLRQLLHQERKAHDYSGVPEVRVGVVRHQIQVAHAFPSVGPVYPVDLRLATTTRPTRRIREQEQVHASALLDLGPEKRQPSGQKILEDLGCKNSTASIEVMRCKALVTHSGVLVLDSIEADLATK